MIKFIKQYWFAFVIPTYFLLQLFTNISELIRIYKYSEVILRISPLLLISFISYIIVYFLLVIYRKYNEYANIMAGIIYSILVLFFWINILSPNFRQYICMHEIYINSLITDYGILALLTFSPLIIQLIKIFSSNKKVIYKLFFVIFLFLPIILAVIRTYMQVIEISNGDCFFGI